jgi:hypothetical protein
MDVLCVLDKVVQSISLRLWPIRVRKDYLVSNRLAQACFKRVFAGWEALMKLGFPNYGRYRSKKRSFLYTYPAAQSEAAFLREIAAAPRATVADLRPYPMPCKAAMTFTLAHLPPLALTSPLCPLVVPRILCFFPKNFGFSAKLNVQK